jgi:hypothetical protein
LGDCTDTKAGEKRETSGLPRAWRLAWSLDCGPFLLVAVLTGLAFKEAAAADLLVAEHPTKQPVEQAFRLPPRASVAGQLVDISKDSTACRKTPDGGYPAV